MKKPALVLPDDLENLQKVLMALPMFSGLDAEQLGGLTRGARILQAPRGSILFHAGDTSDGFHVLCEGHVKLSMTSPNGNEKVIDLVGPGRSFGEAVMFMEVPYVVTAEALSEVRLIVLSRQVLFEEIERHPRIARCIIACMAQRLHQLTADVESYTLRTARQRVAGFLLELAGEQPDGRRDGMVVEFVTRKGVIASRLNLTQEHFSRVLHELALTGLIRVQGRAVELCDLRGLCSAAH